MSKLSVNVNKLATLRNSRGGDNPNLVSYSSNILRFGAEGLTVHPRPDERHIRKTDVYELAKVVQAWNRKYTRYVEYNIEGYPSEDYLRLVEKVRPDQATLVPDKPSAITSNAGWRLRANEKKLRNVLQRLRRAGVRSSLFIDVFTWSAAEEAALARLKPDRIELYTEKFAHDYPTKSRAKTTAAYAKVARAAQALGIGVNAGHDLSLENVRHLVLSIPEVLECSIGHALIAESLYLGLRKTIQTYRREMRPSRRAKTRTRVRRNEYV